MKKTIAILFALATTAVFAGANDLLVMFYTTGPDKYADGTVVLDNECYSLVYTDNATGEQQCLITLPAAKNGKCNPIFFSVDENDVKNNYNNGTWGVYLLDTRDFEKDSTGQTLSTYDKVAGKPTHVNVKAAVTDAVASVPGAKAAVGATGGVAAGSYDLSKIEKPVVSGIQVIGANVVVTVKNTVPFVGYTLQSGSDVTNLTVPADATTKNGDATGEITLVTPKKDGAQFFKVSTIK